METKILNYRIIIEKEQNGRSVRYVAHVPTLGISDFGKTVELAMTNIEQAIELYIQTLLELKKSIPSPDSEEYYITTSKVELKNLPKNYAF